VSWFSIPVSPSGFVCLDYLLGWIRCSDLLPVFDYDCGVPWLWLWWAISLFTLYNTVCSVLCLIIRHTHIQSENIQDTCTRRPCTTKLKSSHNFICVFCSLSISAQCVSHSLLSHFNSLFIGVLKFLGNKETSDPHIENRDRHKETWLKLLSRK